MEEMLGVTTEILTRENNLMKELMGKLKEAILLAGG